MVIHSNYDVNPYDGKKFVVISTVSVLGGKDFVLGGILVAVGASGILGSFVFWLEYYYETKMKGRQI